MASLVYYAHQVAFYQFFLLPRKTMHRTPQNIPSFVALLSVKDSVRQLQKDCERFKLVKHIQIIIRKQI